MEKTLPLIDSHAHLSLFPKEELENILQRAKEKNIERIINVCIDLPALEQGLFLIQKHPWISLAAALTPHDALKEREASFFSKAAEEKKLVAIGETGLDYHHHSASKESQKKLLIQTLHFAESKALPLIFHCRDAFRDLFEITKSELSSSRALLHCFTGTKEEAKEALKRGWSISFSGILSFAKNDLLKEVAAFVPLDRILIETDAPYLAPNPYRGKRNEPAYLFEVAKALALLRKESIETIATATTKNTCSFFSLKSISSQP
jgi:TatD DNase family protein